MKLKVLEIISILLLLVGFAALHIDDQVYGLFLLARFGIPLIYAIGGYFIFKPGDDIRFGTGLIIFNSFVLAFVLFLTASLISSSMPDNGYFFWFIFPPCVLLIAGSVLILYRKNKEKEKRTFVKSVLVRNACILGFCLLVGLIPASWRVIIFHGSDSVTWLKYKQRVSLDETERYLAEKNYDAAITMALESISYSEKIQDSVSSLYRQSLNSLGYCYYASDQNNRADSVYQIALKIPEYQEVYDYEFKRTLYYCGMLYSDMGYYHESDSMLNRCLTQFSNKNEELMYIYGISATNQKERGHLLKADSLYRLTLAKHKDSGYTNKEHYISTLSDLGINYCDRSLYPQADSVYQVALVTAKENFGEQSTIYADVIDKLMQLSMIQADYTKAESLGNKSLQIKKSLLGITHSNYLYSLVQMASVKIAQSKYEEAKTSLLSCLSTIGQRYSLKSPLACGVYDNLVDLYEDYEQFAEAEYYADKSLEARIAYYGVSNINTARSFDNKAYLYYYRGKLQEADSLYDKALRIKIRYTGRNNPGFAHSLNGWGLVLTAQNHLPKADTVFNYALEVLSDCVGEKHPYYAQTLHNKGWLKLNQQRFAEAENYFRESLSLNRAHFGEQHLKVAINYVSLAYLKKQVHAPFEALDYFKKSLRIYLKLFGPKHPKIEILQKEIFLLEKGL